MTDTLKAGESLVPGGSVLTSGNQRYFLVMQGDGNLVMYHRPNGPAIWSTATDGSGASRADMQGDGNFVLYRPDNMPEWNTGTRGQGPNSRLVMQGDRNLVLYDQNTPIWASNTALDPNSPVTAHVEDDIGNRKFMSTDATLYRNGYLTLSTYSQSRHPTEGLKGYVLVICIDVAGRAIWVSEQFECTTRCPTLDFCSSAGTNTFSQSFPDAVGQLAKRLNIYHSDQGFGRSRENFVKTIKTATDATGKIKEALGQLG